MRHLSLGISWAVGLLGFSLASAVTFEKWFGGTENDNGTSVVQTSWDRGYIVTGYRQSSGAPAVYLIKTDSLGDTLWTSEFRRGNSVGCEVVLTGTLPWIGYVIAGYCDSNTPDWYNVYLLQIAPNGDTMWTREYGDPFSQDFGYSVAKTTDGGYIIGGYTHTPPDVLLVRTDSDGNLLWTRAYGGPGDDYGYSVVQASTGYYAIAGSTGGSFPSYDVYLMKTNDGGDSMWARTYGGASLDCGYSLAKTTDGGYIMAGQTFSFGAGSSDVYLIKTGPLGDTLWTRTYGDTAYDCGNSVAQTTDGGYIIAGFTTSYGAGSNDVYLIKTDSLGDTLWTRTYGGTFSDRGSSVAQTTDGGYIIAGETWSYGVGTPGHPNVYLIKTDSLGSTGIEERFFSGAQKVGANFSLRCEPNPFTSVANIRYSVTAPTHVNLKIYNSAGQVVRNLVSEQKQAGDYRMHWDGTDDNGKESEAGVYFSRVEAGDFKVTKKMILLH